jgi:holin-like protein
LINGLLGLLTCQLIGEVGVRLLHLPIPGPVLGMLVLFGYLTWRRPGAGAGIVRASDGLLKHLQLLFIPAGVGVITMFGEIGHAPLPLLAGLVVSWVAGLATVGWIASALIPSEGRER